MGRRKKKKKEKDYLFCKGPDTQDQGSQREERESEGTSPYANQGSQDYNQENTLW